MAKGKELRALPSKVILPDGDTIPFDALTESDRGALRREMCRRIGHCLGTYYRAHPDRFTAFSDAMTRDDAEDLL